MEKKEYIERGALLEKNMYGNTAPITHRTYAEQLIISAHAADVAPVVHGEWLLKHEGYGHYWLCSVCNTNPCIYVTENTKFCPNCGAKMDGGNRNADA